MIVGPVLSLLVYVNRGLKSLTQTLCLLSTLSAIFTELMESMQTWYQSSALEADYYRRKAKNNHKKMAMDPRTHKPFRDEHDFTPVSARSSIHVHAGMSSCITSLTLYHGCNILTNQIALWEVYVYIYVSRTLPCGYMACVYVCVQITCLA